MQPWCDVNGKYSLFQISKSYNSMSNLEIVSALNLYSYVRNFFHYNSANSPAKYAIRINIGIMNSVGYAWSSDYGVNDGGSGTSLLWPESLIK